MKINPITIANGSAVAQTFEPYRPQQAGLAAVWFLKQTDSPIGYARITALSKQREDGGYKIDISISDPVLAVIDGNCCVDKNSPQVSYTEFANLSFVIPRGATVSHRKDILAYAKNLLGDTVATDLIVNNNVIY